MTIESIGPKSVEVRVSSGTTVTLSTEVTPELLAAMHAAPLPGPCSICHGHPQTPTCWKCGGSGVEMHR